MSLLYSLILDSFTITPFGGQKGKQLKSQVSAELPVHLLWLIFNNDTCYAIWRGRMLLVLMKTTVLNFCLLGNNYASFGRMFSYLPSQCSMIVRSWYLSVSHFFLKTTQLISKGFFHWHGINVIKYTIVKLQNPWAFNLSKPEKLNTSYCFQSFIPSRRNHLLSTKNHSVSLISSN